MLATPASAASLQPFQILPGTDAKGLAEYSFDATCSTLSVELADFLPPPPADLSTGGNLNFVTITENGTTVLARTRFVQTFSRQISVPVQTGEVHFQLLAESQALGAGTKGGSETVDADVNCGPAGSQQPTEPGQPTQPTDPGQPTQSTDPGQPSQPANPSHSTDPHPAPSSSAPATGSGKVKTSTSVTSNADSVPYGVDKVKLTATVSPAPIGSVRFTVGAASNPLPCGSVRLANGVATCSVSSAALGKPGTYRITANYLGSTGYEPSSGGWTQVISKATPRIAIDAVHFGSSASVTAVVTPSYALPLLTGGGKITVTLTDVHGTPVKGVAFGMPGIVECSTYLGDVGAANGPYTITVDFSGNSLLSAARTTEKLPAF